MSRRHSDGGPIISRRRVLIGVAAGSGTTLLPSIVRAAIEPRKGGTLHLAMPYNPASIDPMTGRNLPDFNVLYAIYDALIDFDPDTLQLKPGLASAWRFENATALVLDLVDGAQFHDGTPFNPEAAKFNLDRYKSDPRSNVKADLNALANVEITGKNQITLHLARPNAGLPAILTNRVGLMVSPTSVKTKGPDVNRIGVGTGPFKFLEWQDNDRFALVKNGGYWRSGLPYLDGISMSIVNELNTAVRTVMSGETDLALNMQVPQKLIADRSNNVVTETGPSLVFGNIAMNYSRGPLSDVRVRQAINYGLDRDELNKVLAAGLGEPTCAVLPKEHWACDPSTIHYYKHDPDRARALLKEAGYPNGIDLAAFGWPDQMSMQRQELITTELEKSGIRIKLTPTTPQQAMQRVMIEKRGDMLMGPTGGFPDPSQFYEALLAKDALRNPGKIEIPGFRPLMDATEATSDMPTRKVAFARLQRFVIEQALQAPQYIWPTVNVMSSRLRNFRGGIIGTPKFQEVWLAA